MTARNTSASATDLRLRRSSTLVVIKTVKRLAATVSINRTIHDNNPALVRIGNLTVDINADSKSTDPITEIRAKKAGLFQLDLFVMRFSWSQQEGVPATPIFVETCGEFGWK